MRAKNHSLLAAILLTIFAVLWMVGCSGSATTEGGTEFGNPSRDLIGVVVASNESAEAGSAEAEPFSCPADTTMATDSAGASLQTTIQDDCSFQLTLEVAAAYFVSFMLEGEFVAVLIVTNEYSTLNSTTIIVAAGDDPIDLGEIIIGNGEAIPEHEPGDQNDQDGDGTPDAEDSDDDEDGIADWFETDCDLDGYPDDYDDDNSSCAAEEDAGEDEDPGDGDDEAGDGEEEENDSGEGGEEEISYGTVLEVYPNNEGSEVWLGEIVAMRFDCDINPETVNESTFWVGTADGESSVTCSFYFNDGLDEMYCVHDDNEFLPAAYYIGWMDGFMCNDGRSVTPIEWYWTTWDGG